MRYAGFWRRFFAYLIDLFILGFVAALLRAVTGAGDLGVVDFLDVTDDGDALAPNAASVVLTWLYFAWLESSSAWRATWGKRALGMVVVDLEGNRISLPRASGRFFAKFLSALLLLLGFVMVAFTRRKQALHDKLADTLVVRA
jgi:uncharacterized RDD family membrane protein YckC